MSRSRYRFGDATHPHFVTCTVVGWLPVFTRPEAVEIVLDSWKFLQDQGRLVILGYVILENHAHFVAWSDDPVKQIGDFKSFTARIIIDLLVERHEQALLDQFRQFKAAHKTDRTYQLWQEGSHPQMIQDEAMLRQKIEYIHQNPVRRGYVDEPSQWRYSSARTYEGRPGLLPITTEW